MRLCPTCYQEPSGKVFFIEKEERTFEVFEFTCPNCGAKGRLVSEVLIYLEKEGDKKKKKEGAIINNEPASPIITRGK